MLVSNPSYMAVTNNVSVMATQPNLAFKKHSNEEKTDKYIKTEEQEDQNPVSKVGEYFSFVSKSLYRSLGVGAKAAMYSFLYNCNSNKDDNSSLTSNLLVGSVTAVVVFLFTIPKALYQANVEYSRKKNDFENYRINNKSERILLEQMHKRLKEHPEKADQISKNYLKVRLVKNEVPDSLTKDKDSNMKEFLKGFTPP